MCLFWFFFTTSRHHRPRMRLPRSQNLNDDDNNNAIPTKIVQNEDSFAVHHDHGSFDFRSLVFGRIDQDLRVCQDYGKEL